MIGSKQILEQLIKARDNVITRLNPLKDYLATREFPEGEEYMYIRADIALYESYLGYFNNLIDRDQPNG